MLRKLFEHPPAAHAELARNVAAGGGEVALSTGGALEIRDADAAGGVIVAEVDGLTGPPGLSGSDAEADDRDALHSGGAVVLGSAARHDLVAEATGGAEGGTAVTAATPIDVASAEARTVLDAVDTFTLAALLDAVDAPQAAPAGAEIRL
jgi:6,7-dimethyl-8-ribityllumazine synthase